MMIILLSYYDHIIIILLSYYYHMLIKLIHPPILNQQFLHEMGLEKRSRSINSANRREISFRVFLDRLEIRNSILQKNGNRKTKTIKSIKNV